MCIVHRIGFRIGSIKATTTTRLIQAETIANTALFYSAPTHVLQARLRLWWLLCAPCRGCCFFYFRLQAAAYYFYLCFQILSCSHLDYPPLPSLSLSSSCYFTFGTFPGQQQQTHVLLACFSCCFPATRFVAQPLLYCVYCLSVCLFVSLSACLYVSLSFPGHFAGCAVAVTISFVVPFIAFAFAAYLLLLLLP